MSFTKWIPFDEAAKLRCLKQGSLAVGNTRQRIANLRTLATANAAGAQTFAKYQFNSNKTRLLIRPASVPGFKKPGP